MYSIKKGVIYDNGITTEVNAVYTKKEICILFGWSRETGRKMFNEIAHKLYCKNPDGTYINTKKIFSPNELCYILDFYGLP